MPIPIANTRSRVFHIVALLLMLKAAALPGQTDLNFPSPDSGKAVVDWILALDDDQLPEAEQWLARVKAEASPRSLPYLEKGMGLLAAFQGRDSLAIRSFRKAIQHSRVDAGIYQDLYSNLCRNIAQTYMYMDGFSFRDSAKFYFQKALKAEDAAPVYSDQYPFILQLSGNLYRSMGDADQAMKLYLTWAEHQRAQPGDATGLANAYNELAILHAIDLEDPDRAISYAQKGLALPQIAWETQRNLTFNLALALEMKGTFLDGDSTEYYHAAALRQYQEASGWYRQPPIDEYRIAQVQNNTGLLYLLMGRYELALDSIRLAEQDNRAVGDFIELANNLDNKGEALYRLGRIPEAANAFSEALDLSFAGFTPTDIFDLPDPDLHPANDKWGALETVASRAKVYQRLYEDSGDEAYLRSALDHYAFIDRYFDSLRRSFQAEASKFSLARRAKPVLEEAIAAHLFAAEHFPSDADQLTSEALRYADKAKALVLLEYMNQQEAARAVLPIKERERFFELLRQRDLSERELAEATIYGDPQALIQTKRRNLLAARQKLEDWQRQTADRYPDFKRLSAVQVNTDIFQQDVRELVSGDQSLIEFFLGKDQSYAFIRTESNLRVVQLPPADSLRGQIRQTLSGIRDYYEGEASYEVAKDNFTRGARKLYQRLIEPLGPLADHLIIIPDEELLYLPFETLLTSDVPPNTAYGDYPYWIRRKTIRYAFSISLLREMEKKRSPAEGRLMGGFLPVFPRDSFPKDQTAPLPVSSSFVADLERSLQNSQVFFQDHATRDAFVEHAGDFRILHPVTHTYIDEVNPNLTEIRFWDGGLKLRDLFRVRMATELVVLHSCETNAGTLLRGEGLASINRGFVSAGASSVLASFWRLRDGRTPLFMEPFYQKYLLRGMPKDAAVRQAKLEMIAADPYDWAPYALYGDASPISMTRDVWPFWQLYALGLLVLAIVYLGYRIRNKQSQEQKT